MRKTYGIIALAAALFAAGCGQDEKTAEEIAALRKEVAELRADVKKLSRRTPGFVQSGDERPVRTVAPDGARAQRPMRAQRGENGADGVRKALTPEERKARIEEMRRRHEERKQQAAERRAKRQGQRAGEGAAAENAGQPQQETSQQTENQ